MESGEDESDEEQIEQIPIVASKRKRVDYVEEDEELNLDASVSDSQEEDDQQDYDDEESEDEAGLVDVFESEEEFN